MSTASTVKHTLKHKDGQPRQKRFKVGKACFTCRVKKIKCDGLQPCMQCKARSRPCSFSKDGTAESNEEENEDNSNNNSTEPSPISSPIIVNRLPFDPKKTKSNNTVADNLVATDILNRLFKVSPGEGKEGKWEFDTNGLHISKSEINQPYRQLKVDLPPKPTQQHLIQLYFKHCYSTFPIIPKRLFYRQFDSSSSKLLTSPILLSMIFAHGAQYQQKTMMEADSYFQNAKILLNEEMNYPSLGTVIALILMSLYESGDNQCSTMYSAMAFQMFLDLGLMRNYSGNDYSSAMAGEISSEMMEVKKRVCWGCYYLDKVIHIQSGQPWIIRSKDIELDMPLLQPGDDITEHEILEGFVATIKLWKIAEHILQPQSLQQVGQPVIRTHTHDQMSLNGDNELLHWLRSLPPHLQWTPLAVKSTPPAIDTPSNPLVCQIHLLYNIIELYVIKPYASSTVKSIRQLTIARATNITRLITTLSDNPFWIFNNAFTMNCLFESTKFHLRDCACEIPNLAQHARYMFQRSMQTMKALLLHDHKRNSITVQITQFLVGLEELLATEDSNNLFNQPQSQQNEVNEDDMMTPFVLGSLNSKHGGEEERQQWSKLDYFANGLITPPTVKSKANLYYHPPSSTSSSTNGMINFNPTSMYHHSASTDNVFHTSWRASMTPDRFQYTRANSNPLDFLSSEDQHNTWHPSRATHYQKSSSPVNNSPNKPRPPFTQQQQSATTAELLLSQTDPSDIAALVAQIQDNSNKEGNTTSSNASDTNGDEWNTSSSTSTPHIVNNNDTSTATTTTTTSNSENLIYSLLSSQQQNEQRVVVTEPQTTSQQQNKQQQHYNNSFVTYPYTNVGLGIYASAHQHHNDVIRQHLPINNNNNNNSMALLRPDMLTHQGQVLVTNNNTNMNNNNINNASHQ